MTAKEFLKNEKSINLSEIANRMWPTNKSAKTYLSRKLNGALPWTDADEQSAVKVLKDLCIKVKSL